MPAMCIRCPTDPVEFTRCNGHTQRSDASQFVWHFASQRSTQHNGIHQPLCLCGNQSTFCLQQHLISHQQLNRAGSTGMELTCQYPVLRFCRLHAARQRGQRLGIMFDGP